MESWQIFNAARRKLPQGELQRLFTRSVRLVDYWAADPKYCDETKRNPIDRIRAMLEALDLCGVGEFARAAIDYMAAPLGGCFAYAEPAHSDKGTIEGETADVTIALGKLADEIRFCLEDDTIDAAERIRIKEYARRVKKEVDELLDAAGIVE